MGKIFPAWKTLHVSFYEDDIHLKIQVAPPNVQCMQYKAFTSINIRQVIAIVLHVFAFLLDDDLSLMTSRALCATALDTDIAIELCIKQCSHWHARLTLQHSLLLMVLAASAVAMS